MAQSGGVMPCRRYWALDETQQMWKEHLNATLAEAVVHLSDDCAGDVVAQTRRRPCTRKIGAK
jgi:hypothetical protein